MSGPLALIAADDLREMIREEVMAVLEEHSESEHAPALVDRRGLARALRCGVDSVDRLRREGCPEVTVGDMPRFCPADVLAWLKSREGK